MDKTAMDEFDNFSEAEDESGDKDKRKRKTKANALEDGPAQVHVCNVDASMTDCNQLPFVPTQEGKMFADSAMHAMPALQ
jgi:hypothetical protein